MVLGVGVNCQRCAPDSGEIFGILNYLAGSQKPEADRKADHAARVAAMENGGCQFDGDGRVARVTPVLRVDTKRSLAADEELAAKLVECCGGQSSAWQERWKSRAEEIVAVHDTIDLLSDDEARPSLVQVQRSTTRFAKRALGCQSRRLKHLPGWDFKKVKPKSEVVEQAKKDGICVHFATLVVLFHLKHSEKTNGEWCSGEMTLKTNVDTEQYPRSKEVPLRTWQQQNS